MIIPAQFLTTISNSGFADGLFRRLRDQENDFPLRDERYRASKILVSQSNFGCGSSREHAVWALRDWGFKVICAESFADIFAGNAAKSGLLLVTLPSAEIELLLASAKSRETSITVDLKSQLVTLDDGRSIEFAYDTFRKHCLLEGLDDLDYILSHKKDIEQFHKSHANRLFFTDGKSIG